MLRVRWGFTDTQWKINYTCERLCIRYFVDPGAVPGASTKHMTLRERGKIRIRQLILATEECIVYTPVDTDGYGRVNVSIGDDRGHFRAHRLSYELANNVVLSKDQLVCHACDNPPCINPKHLFLGTHADNVRDKVAKGRQAKGRVNGRYKHGHESQYAHVDKPRPQFESLFGRTLTEERAKAVKRAVLSRGDTSIRQLSIDLCVSVAVLNDILRGKTYKNL